MAGQNPGSPTDFQYFYEDEVFKINNIGQVVFGLVLENYETNSSDQESDVETPIQKGEIRVVWHPTGNERVVSEKSVGLADRSLMPGDVVRRMIRGKDTQRGYCRDIIMTAAVQVVGTNHVIPCVASERLQPLEEFTSDLAVCLDSWVGTSKTVHSKLRLVSADGSRLEYPDPENCPLEDCSVRQRKSAFYTSSDYYYPGQVVTCPLGSLEHANWIHTTKDMKVARKHKMREYKFTVEGVEAESVGVHWQCRALCTSGDAVGPPLQPRFLVEGEDLKRLKLLNVFEPCTLQVGDRSFLTISEDDKFTLKKQWRKGQSKYYRAVRRATRPQRSRDKEESKDSLKETQPSNLKQSHAEQPASNKHTSHGPSKPKKRSLHNRDLIKTLYYIPSHTGKMEKDSKSTQSKMEIDVMVNHASDVKNTEDSVKQKVENDGSNSEGTVLGDMHKNPTVFVELVESKEPIEMSTEVSEGFLKETPKDNQSIEGFTLAKRVEEINAQEDRMSRMCEKDAKDVILNAECKRNESINSLSVNNEDDEENWENTSSDDATDTDSGATWSSRCSSGANSAAGMGPPGTGKKSPQLATKFLRGARLKRTARRAPAPVPGAKVVVETLCTTGRANVVWQDGTIELGIPSTQLYPIHHLDNQECFPGDFVVLGDAGGTGAAGLGEISQRDYGVVQRVDHHGRTAVVKWFRTYTTDGEPVPELLSENEVSVYDLKDHPDFQYRPGTVVIRVANFTGTETNCTAGQVIDNFPSGRVKVWWADGHTSMCWPQDLYKVGEYDSDDGELWAEDNDGSDDGSWVTQSEDDVTNGLGEAAMPYPEDEPLGRGRILQDFFKNLSNTPKMVPLISPLAQPTSSTEVVSITAAGETTGSGAPKIPRLLEPRVAAHIERGRVAMQRLEEMFFMDPKLQTQEVMRKLLNLYKECRFLDRLMGTSFFHEELFQGLLERVRERGETASSKESQRLLDQVHRLFATSAVTTIAAIKPADFRVPENSSPSNSPKAIDRPDSAPNASPIQNIDNESIESSPRPLTESLKMECDVKSTENLIPGNAEYMDIESDANPQILVDCVLMDRPSSVLHKTVNNEDSGMECQMFSNSLSVNNTTLSNNSSERSFPSSEYLMQDSTVENPPPVTDKPSTLVEAGPSTSVESASSIEDPTRNVCYKLCSLIRAQLVLAHAEVSRRRPALLAHFLNKLMTMQSSQEEQLPYYFTVQYGALVVSMNDAKIKNLEEKDESDPQPVCDFNDINSTKENEPPPESNDNLDLVQEKNDAEPVLEVPKSPSEFSDGFSVLESAPSVHRFQLSMLQPSEPRLFFQAVRREMRLLRSDLPPLVWVRTFEDRIDLLSLMIGGPEKTPYEDGLFLFDVQLGGEYPKAPPLCHYISYCTDRLNPNLYEDGKVCVSLLGTWSGRGVEVWGKDSSLLQVIVSLQGLILNSEPYFNEAGYEKQKGSQQGRENSRMYNEMVILKLVQSMTKMVTNPPEIFKSEIQSYLSQHGPKLCERLDSWMAMSEVHNGAYPDSPMTPDTFRESAGPSDLTPPEFPLIPASRGFCLTLKSSLDCYRRALQCSGILQDYQEATVAPL